MPAPDPLITLIREWLAKADNDLTNAATLDIPLSEARQAVAVARRVRREVRGHLPRGSLRRKRK